MGGATRPADSRKTGGNRTQDSFAKEGTMNRMNRIIEALVLVRLGQELGTDSDLAQTLAGCIDAAIKVAAIFLG